MFSSSNRVESMKGRRQGRGNQDGAANGNRDKNNKPNRQARDSRREVERDFM